MVTAIPKPDSRRLASLLLTWLVTASGAATPPGVTGAEAEAVKSALKKGGYDWYDGRAERVVPVLSQPDFEAGVWKRIGDWFNATFKGFGDGFRWLNGWGIPGVAGLGDLVAIGLVMLVLTLVLVGLLELLRRYRPVGGDSESPAALAGRAQRIEGLPAGVRFDATDPWAEAQRLRARGDYSRAVIYLFAHQLLQLGRTGQLRLVPGRTGRQLVRSVGDRTLGGLVEPTLRLFEGVYYGHQVVSAEAFEDVWVKAEAFERSLATLAAGAAR